MKKNTNASIDGFIPRRAGSELGDQHRSHARTASGSEPRPRKELQSQEDLTNQYRVGSARPGYELGRADLDESLRSIDESPEAAGSGRGGRKISRKERRRLKKESRTKAQRIRRRIILIAVWLLIAVIVGVGGYLAFKLINTGGRVLQGNIFDIVQSQPLKQDANGRSNFLVFGTAEDSEGGMHGGANLTDSIMVISVDQTKKDAYMLSLPRDMWVRYDMPQGEVCSVGYEGKLNAQYFCASNDGENEAAGAEALSATVADITGLDMQYYIHLNFTAVTEAVDAVGGVEVVIESEDPRGILDRNFDWRCNYQCYFVNYQNGERVQLDGEHALALARARNASGGYGLPNGNFDREKNQQKIIKALREKAVSAGTLTNLGAVTGLIDALGNNLRTNVQTNEFRTLMDVASNIPTESIISLSLNDEENMLVTTGNYSGQSIVRPIAGITNYSEIRAYIQRQISSEPYVREDAAIVVLNGSGVAGIAQTAADALSDQNFNVIAVDNAPEATYPRATVYQIATDKSATAAKLAEVYGVTVTTTPPPFSVVGEADFVVIIGDASAVTQTQ